VAGDAALKHLPQAGAAALDTLLSQVVFTTEYQKKHLY